MSSTNYQGRSQSGASSMTNDEGLQILSAFYTRTYPSADELTTSLDQFTDGELEEVVTELRNEVAALHEETEAMRHQVDDLRGAAAAGGGGAPNSKSHAAVGDAGGSTSLGLHGPDVRDDGVESTGAQTPSRGMSASASTMTVSGASASAAAMAASSSGLSGGTRRGQRYRRKSATMGDLVQYVRVEDKMKLLEVEMNRVHDREAREGREMEQVRDALVATAEEATRRMRELRLEVMQLHREVLDQESGDATADELVRYLHRRETTQSNYLDKIQTQCQSAEVEIRRAQVQARQRRAAGEAFQPIDFDQLRIENQQFTERLEKKNAELAELKAMSTRTVQSLNALTDGLNAITAEQARLKRESKSRSEYLTRCQQDVQVASKEATQAEKKNVNIKSQQESVKVPKIEEYIAQKAELYELEKALKNWRRKVEIAEGQVSVVRQQTRKLTQQQKQAEEYAETRKNRARRSLARGSIAVTASASASTTAGRGGPGASGFGVHGGGVAAHPAAASASAAASTTTAAPGTAPSRPGAARGGGGAAPRGRGPRGRGGARAGGSLTSGSKNSHPFAGSLGSSTVDGASPRYIPHTPSAGDAPAASTPPAGLSHSSVGLSSQVLVGGAGKAVLDAKRAATPPAPSPTYGADAEETDIVTE